MFNSLYNESKSNFSCGNQRFFRQKKSIYLHPSSIFQTLQACENMGSALDKFHEQRKLIKEAIMSVAMKHLKNTVMVLSMVQEELVTRIKNFNCNTVLPDVVSVKLCKMFAKHSFVP